MLTVITPTYNRAHTLGNVYESLCDQTCKDFLWMIVDDGSVDNTESVVKEWISDKRINIQYIKKENGGKGSALNVGLDHLQTELTTCLDSDDTMFPDAVNTILQQYQQIKNDPQCCGILAYRSNADGTPMKNSPIPDSWSKLTAADLFMKKPDGGEIICFYKAEMITGFRFPTYKNENFFSPAWMQYEVSRNAYFVPCREPICCCEYLEDGLTKNVRKICAQNPHCYRDVKKMSFEFAITIKQIMKHGILYDTSCLMCKDPRWFLDAPRKGWAFVLMPVAFFVYIIRYKKYMKK